MAKTISEQLMADWWDTVVPPPDGQIVINRFGTVVMSYETFKMTGYDFTGEEKEKVERMLIGKEER